MLIKIRGFTLIEVLIVVAIIGILAVLLIPNAITAIQKSKQKSTMKDIMSIATAASDYMTDNGEWTMAQSGDIIASSEFVLSITPFYIKVCPVTDLWGEPYKVYLGDLAAVRSILSDDIGPEDFVIESYGRDGISDGWEYDPAATEDDFYTVDGWQAFKNDMVNWNGSWIRAPRVGLPSGN
jgi:prepilin-type N-terminal cleavage/methylation domain-containing protein